MMHNTQALSLREFTGIYLLIKGWGDLLRQLSSGMLIFGGVIAISSAGVALVACFCVGPLKQRLLNLAFRMALSAACAGMGGIVIGIVSVMYELAGLPWRRLLI